jgi:branched-chain amino acid transport system ATP-binding protein
MMENSIVLHAQDLVAGYIPEVNILNGCDLEVRAGEFVGIIGPNGAGKSTLLKAILGLCKVRSGSISLNGVDITGRKAHELVPLGVGYVPQTKNVFPSLTVKENLEMGCFLKPSVFKERFAYVAAMFPKLADRAAQRAGALSGGERQMLAVARALMTDPEMLLMDEPTEGLAPVMVQHLEEIVAELGKTGLGILLVEQNLYSALSVAHEVYLMETGEIVHHCLADELMNDRDTMQRFLGVR